MTLLIEGKPAVRPEAKNSYHRYTVRVEGRPVFLTAKSFTYLARLAAAQCGRLGRGGWISKDDIEPGLNQSRYLYRLKRELMAQGCEALAQCIQGNCRGHYRLDMDAQSIGFSRDELSKFPAQEVRSLVC